LPGIGFLSASVVGSAFRAPARLDEGDEQLAQCVSERLLVAAPEGAEPFDQGAQCVDGELGLLEVGRFAPEAGRVHEGAQWRGWRRCRLPGSRPLLPNLKELFAR
jgi:hypothetical protein